MTQKDRIVAVATELFIKKGCRALTMDDVSIANGISKRTLYELFKDKQSLIEGCLEAMKNRKIESLNKLKKESQNVIEALLKLHNFESEEVEKTSFAFMDDLRKHYPECYEANVKKLKKEHTMYTLQLIEEGIEQGVFVNNIGDVTIMANVLSHFVAWNFHSDLFDLKKEKGRKAIFESTVMVYLRGISTIKGIQIIDEKCNSINKQ